jgi:hypothetical protein
MIKAALARFRKTEPVFAALLQKNYSKIDACCGTVDNIPANHCVPSEDYGTPCGDLNTDNYIENCNLPAFRHGSYQTARES